MEKRLGPQESSSNQDTKLGTIQQQTQEVICRLFFVRHGVSEEEMKKGKNSKQLGGNSTLHKLGIEQIRKASQILKKMGCKKEDTLILYAPGKNQKDPVKRVTESADIFHKNEIGELQEHHSLDTSDKVQLPDGSVTIKDGRLFTRVEQLYEIMKLTSNEILKSFTGDNQFEYRKYQNIVLLGHKSNAGISEIVKKEGQTVEICKQDIEPGEIWQFDINGQKEYLNYEKESHILCLDYRNIDAIAVILRDEEGLQESIEAFCRGAMKSFQLQNAVNTHFRSYPELYEKYLGSEQNDLRVFCLANLLKLGQYKNIEKTYLDPNHNFPLSQEEKRVFIKNMFSLEVQKILPILFISNKQIRGNDEERLFNEYGLVNFYKYLVERRNNYEKAVTIQRRSFDVAIKKQITGSILGRDIYRTLMESEKSIFKEDIEIQEEAGESEESEDEKESKNKKDKKKFREKEKKKQSNIDEAITLAGVHHKHVILPMHVGNGKSIWISELVKRVSTHYDFDVSFFEGNYFDDIMKRVKVLKDMQEDKVIEGPGTPVSMMKLGCPQKILCIDAIDEIKDIALRQKIKKDLKGLPYGVIVTSRMSEYNDQENEGFVTLQMNPVNKYKFISSKTDTSSQRDLVISKLEESNLVGEIEGNPLLLNFVCMLANQEGTYQVAGIKNLETIENKADLYENIVKLMLLKHEGFKSDRYLGTDGTVRLEDDMRILGKFAHMTYKQLDIEIFKQENRVREKDLERLNILFKRTHENTYGFIHKSFEEFFLARYLAQQEGAEEIYQVRDGGVGQKDWNTWKEFRPIVDFYGEILVNQGKKQLLEEFLGEEGILKNDDIFGYNFALGLSIINKMGQDEGDRCFQEAQKLYSQKIEGWEDNEVLNRFFFMHSLFKNNKSGGLNDVLYDRVIKVNKNIEVHERFAERRNPNAIRYLFEHANELFEKGQNVLAANIYKKLIGTGDSLAIEQACKHIRQLFKIDDYHNGRIFLEGLIKSGNGAATREIYKLAHELFEQEEYYLAGEIYEKLTRTEDKMLMEYIRDCADRLAEKGDFEKAEEMYEFLVAGGDRKAIQHARTCADILLEKKHYYRVGRIYEFLAQSSDLTEQQAAYHYANKLFEGEQYERAKRICQTLAETGDPQMKYQICALTNKFLIRSEYTYTRDMYSGFAESSDLMLRGQAYDGANNLFKQRKYLLAGEIYERLARSGDITAIQQEYNCANELCKLGAYMSAAEIYEKLAKSSHLIAIQHAFEGAKELFEKGKYLLAGHLYQFLAINSPDTMAVGQVCKCINKLFEKGQHILAGRIYQELAKSKNPIAQQQAWVGANILFEKRKYSSAGHVYQCLAKLSNPNVKERIFECAKNLLYKKEYASVGHVCQFLAQLGDQKAKEYIFECAHKLFEKGEYYSAISIIEGISKK